MQVHALVVAVVGKEGGLWRVASPKPWWSCDTVRCGPLQMLMYRSEVVSWQFEGCFYLDVMLCWRISVVGTYSVHHWGLCLLLYQKKCTFIPCVCTNLISVSLCVCAGLFVSRKLLPHLWDVFWLLWEWICLYNKATGPTCSALLLVVQNLSEIYTGEYPCVLCPAGLFQGSCAAGKWLSQQGCTLGHSPR